MDKGKAIVPVDRRPQWSAMATAGTIDSAEVRRPPPSGNRRPRRTPKGRQVDPQALGEVRALLGERPRRRDLLIEHLHLIQDRYGHISPPPLAALAHETTLALAQVSEVAPYSAHFDVVKEGEAPPSPVTTRVCASL